MEVRACFVQTLRFLTRDGPERGAIIEDIQTFRKGLIGVPGGEGSDANKARESLRQNLLRVMCRTERIGMTHNRDSMLAESVAESTLQVEDLNQAALAEKIAQIVGAQDTIEYWKSGPYLLNFMKNYDLRRRFDAWAETDPEPLVNGLRQARKQLLDFDSLDGYQEILPANARLRTLFEDTVKAARGSSSGYLLLYRIQGRWGTIEESDKSLKVSCSHLGIWSRR